ncbi:MAG: glycerophosphodiester phosphodiesterase [Candidatus Binataceae bacterium]
MACSTLDSDFFSLPTPRVIAHRGASGEYPENTLAAFCAAAEAKAPYFELDVHMTRDGVVVVSHDPDLNRICGLDAAIRDLTFADLKQADAGWGFTTTARATFAGDSEFPFRGRGIQVPSLAEVFAAFPEHRYIIEIKQSVPSLAAALLDVIERSRMRRHVLVAGEDDLPIDEVRALAPTLPTGFPYREIVAFMASLAPGAEPCQPRGDALQIPPEYQAWRLVTPQSVAAAHRIGAEVHVWTVNDVAEMRAMLELGADGIITDYPARLLALL